jgi:hypothetical protein
MKDNFSHNPSGYATYRPSYPDAIFQELPKLIPSTSRAWDVGTGNGQVAVKLSAFMNHVEATDISAAQMSKATLSSKISYSVQPAEKTNFEDDTFDLITIGQAIHWFDFDKYYAEVYRVAKDQAIIEAIGYDLIKINPAVDKIIDHLYSGILKDYWDPERKYIDDQYRTIPFPFEEIPLPNDPIKVNWTLDHLIGFLNTWSALKHYRTKKNDNPLDSIKSDLREAWGKNESKLCNFPIISRAGKILK